MGPYGSANLLIEQYGLDASVYTAKQADVMLGPGDLEGFNAWMRIGRAIEDMRPTGNAADGLRAAAERSERATSRKRDKPRGLGYDLGCDLRRRAGRAACAPAAEVRP